MRVPKSPPRTRLESLLVDGFALDASPLQRAIALAADGERVPASVLDDAAVERHFGCSRAQLGAVAPKVVCLVAGVRSGKSLMAGAAMLRSALTCPLDQLLSHEVGRAAIVAPTVDNANATFALLVGSVRTSPVLRRLMVGEPTTDTLTLRRPSDGRLVEIVVVAAHRGAVTLRSRWLIGCVLDEVALFGTETAGNAVTSEELLRAAETRLVRGGQAWLVSSPYGPQGLLYEVWRRCYGRPGRVLVVHAPTVAMNTAFDRAQVEEIRLHSPDVAGREYDAQWIDAEAAYLDGAMLDAATRRAPEQLPPDGGAYVAAWDAATRGNAWTLVVSRVTSDGARVTKVAVACARQWVGSKSVPLDVGAVIAEVASAVHPYGVKRIVCDGWSLDAMRPIAASAGLTLVQASTTAEARGAMYEQLRVALSTGTLELAPVPQLVADLKSLRKVATANSIRIELPRTMDGRHCDFAPSVALCVAYAATERHLSSGRSMFNPRFERLPIWNGT